MQKYLPKAASSRGGFFSSPFPSPLFSSGLWEFAPKHPWLIFATESPLAALMRTCQSAQRSVTPPCSKCRFPAFKTPRKRLMNDCPVPRGQGTEPGPRHRRKARRLQVFLDNAVLLKFQILMIFNHLIPGLNQLGYSAQILTCSTYPSSLQAKGEEKKVPLGLSFSSCCPRVGTEPCRNRAGSAALEISICYPGKDLEGPVAPALPWGHS